MAASGLRISCARLAEKRPIADRVSDSARRETTLAFEHAEHADVFLVIGSSLVVHPAAYLPVRAVECGAKLVIVNLETTARIQPDAESPTIPRDFVS